MKNLIFALFLSLVSITAVMGNDSLRFKGIYHFNPQDTVVVSKKRIEMVVTTSEIGRARVRELRSLNYICLVRTARLTECSKFRPGTTHLNQLAIDRHNTKHNGADVVFEDGEFAPSMINDAEAVKEYLYQQKVIFDGVFYSNFKMLVTDQLTKLHFGTPTESSLVVGANGELILQAIETIIESHLVSEMIILESKFIHQD